MDKDDFIEEIDFLNRLNFDDELFEKEFTAIRENFPFKNCSEIYDFLNRNRGVVVLLKKIKPLLDKYVPYAVIHLELDDDPIFVPQLFLVVKALENDFNNGFKDDIRLIDDNIYPLQSKLDLHKEFFIWDKRANKNNISELTLLDMCLANKN